MKLYQKTLATLIAGLMASGLAQAEELTLGLIAPTTVQETTDNWKPLAVELEKALGMKVNLVASTNYSDIVQGMKDNKIQIAWLSSKVAIDAVSVGNATVFAQVVKADGSLGYRSLIITQQNSPIKSLEDLLANGKKYAFGHGDPKSTSGYLIPSYYVFSRNNIDASKHFKSIVYQNHQKNFLAVAEGKLDASTNNTEDMDTFKTEFADKYKNIRILWESDLIPNDPMLFRNDLQSSTKAKIKQFFFSYGKGGAEQRKVLLNIRDLSGFKSSSNSQLMRIADLQMFQEHQKLMLDESVPATEKTARYEEISKKFGRITRMLEVKEKN
ncbi:phosphonate transport system substrate-binding protein [Chitinivorax tropicus]|uniref:Phosphonate transport system substrate-binding protein n=1 Tax=Chitinivorax tropicus TaxID=714531 RepID=A0A840MQV8_9PROT|nr:phosphate/phosphite/phosphonate ABC transporter substrate-binding protein [Chitinivorax tropicus]MBB5019162.1 phosphonate transport system substrate-binding protein [Chitinivorax tropicus]